MGEARKAPKLVAEFIGTYILVLTVACYVLNGRPVKRPDVHGANTTANASALAFEPTLLEEAPPANPAGALSIAAALAISVYAFGPVSGANLNPAVSFSLLLYRKLTLGDYLAYILVQLIAAQAACMMAAQIFVGRDVDTPLISAAWEDDPHRAFLAELVYTFMLCYVVLNTACRAQTNQYFGLAIGLVIVAGGYAVGSISGGVFNPAIASLATTEQFLYYTFAELAGALLATVCTESIDAVNPKRGSKLLSEFIGTFILCCTVCFNVGLGSVAGALSIGASLAAMIFADGGVSGGNFNPAVSTAIFLRSAGATDVMQTVLYILVQFLAGACAGLMCWHVGLNSGAKVEVPDIIAAGWAEVIFTFVLCFVVLCIASVKEPKSAQYNGLTVGLCVVAGGNAVAKVSGGSLNPAVTLALRVSTLLTQAHVPTTFVASEFVAAVFAALVFRATYESEYVAQAREKLSVHLLA